MSQIKSSDEISARLLKFTSSELERRFEHVESVLALAISTILDPRFKEMHFHNILAISKIKYFVSSEVRKLMKTSESKVQFAAETVTAESELAFSNNLYDNHDNLDKITKRKTC